MSITNAVYTCTVVGTPNTAAGSTSSSAGETVPPVQSPAQQSTPQPSMQQASPSHQGQQSQMPITSQFQQPTGMLSNVKPSFVRFQNCSSQSQILGEVCVCLWPGAIMTPFLAANFVKVFMTHPSVFNYATNITVMVNLILCYDISCIEVMNK